MYFVMGPPISANKKDDSYNLILVIVDQLTEMICYELVKVIIDILDLVKLIINMIIHQYKVPKSLIID